VKKWLIVSLSLACVFEPESFAAERVLTQHANEANALLNSLSVNICSGRKREGAQETTRTHHVKGFQPYSVINGTEFMGARSFLCALKLSHSGAKVLLISVYVCSK
jgi:hypothetical protein